MDVRDSTSESLETFRNIENLEPPFEASSFVRWWRPPCTLVLRFVETWASCRSQTGRFGAASLLGRVAGRRRERTGGEQWTVPVSPQGLITPQSEGSARWSRGAGRGRLFLVRGTGSSRFNARQLGMARALAR